MRLYARDLADRLRSSLSRTPFGKGDFPITIYDYETKQELPVVAIGESMLNGHTQGLSLSVRREVTNAG